MRGEGGEGVSQSSASLRLIELRLEAWQQAAILSDTGGNVNDVNDATGARVFQNKLINCLVAPTNFTTHPGPEVRPHICGKGPEDFVTLRQFKIHFKKHEGPVNCPVCTKELSSIKTSSPPKNT